ncbi:transposase [Anabaena sphaerica]|uniref:transposase n=1 Tax=Anabaena sphaerica TaxID=212446 RepID=UPI001F5561B9|nr:transposase [Anabaena sphaerica]
MGFNTERSDALSLSKYRSVKFSSRRIKTKLYKAGNGKLIHADINGSLNILKKVVPTAFSLGIEGVVVRPVGVIPGKQTA